MKTCDWINNKKKYNEPIEVVRNIPGTSVLVGNYKSCDLFGKNIQSDVGSYSKYINFYYIRGTLICIYTLFHITFCISPKHQYQPDGVDIYYPLYHRESRSFVVQYEISNLHLIFLLKHVDQNVYSLFRFRIAAMWVKHRMREWIREREWMRERERLKVWETLNERMKERETTIIKSFVCYPGLQSWSHRVHSHNKDHRNQPAEGPHYVVPCNLLHFSPTPPSCPDVYL